MSLKTITTEESREQALRIILDSINDIIEKSGYGKIEITFINRVLTDIKTTPIKKPNIKINKL